MMYQPLSRHYPPPQKASFFLQHPFLCLSGMFFGAVAVVAFWQLFLTLAIVGVIGFGLWEFTLWWDERFQDRARERRELVVRAEFEHRLLTAGDARGFYGRFPPAI